MSHSAIPFAEILAAAAPGSLVTGAIFVGRLASGSAVEIPYVIAKGAAPGKCLWLNGQVHGDEINGIVAALDFVRALDLSCACADVVVNLHTMGTTFDADPYAVYKVHPNGGVSEETLLGLVAPFLPAVACRMNVGGGTGELPGNLAGALDFQCLDRGQVAFMVELGGGGRLVAAHVAQGIAGFEGLARRLGLLPGAAAAPGELRQVTKRRHVTCAEGGIFRALARPTDIVPTGQPLGAVMDLHGVVREQVILPFDALVIGIRRDPVVHFGDRVAFVAEHWSDVPA